RAEQGAGANRRRQLLYQLNDPQIETDYDYVILEIPPLDEFDDGLGKFRIYPLAPDCLQFDIGNEFASGLIFQQSKNLIQSRYALFRIRRERKGRMAGVEPAADVYLTQFPRSHSRDSAATLAGVAQ